MSKIAMWSVMCLVCGALIGCGEDPEPADDNTTTNNSAAMNNSSANNQATEDPKPWAELDQQGRQMFMATEVMPAMKETFTEIDASYADNFTCVTCHGSDTETFAMPSDISVLSAEELGTFTFEGEGRQEIANAMASSVVPQMAALLGQEPYNPETNTGTFGCASCHMVQ